MRYPYATAAATLPTHAARNDFAEAMKYRTACGGAGYSDIAAALAHIRRRNGR